MEFLDPSLEKSDLSETDFSKSNAPKTESPHLVMVRSIQSSPDVFAHIAFSDRVMYCLAGCSLALSAACGLAGGALFYWLAAGFLIQALIFAVAPWENRSHKARLAAWREEQSALTLMVEIAEPVSEEDAQKVAGPVFVELPTSCRRPEVSAIRSFKCGTRPAGKNGDWR
ncbi:hypothetical protein CCAX7_55120 [Capsulimonas corticalis]|uniref:Uncharacterized protein n=1 Tax=Capsulimonas corticalis TaxID=2219043 RepID=A0A402D5Q0_9BACT|nr:hypothetical protein [Capsulimonas corticalis]BDI33461.1 hypothetical protein CCAX7_55120 [Capsulimonas corticalis]